MPIHIEFQIIIVKHEARELLSLFSNIKTKNFQNALMLRACDIPGSQTQATAFFFCFLPFSRSKPVHVKTRAPCCKPNRDLPRAVLRTLARVKSKIILLPTSGFGFGKAGRKFRRNRISFSFFFFKFLNF